MSDMKMIDNEDRREQRKVMAEVEVPPEVRSIPNRRQRRMIAKRRGVFKHKGAWGYINTRSSKATNQALNGDQPNE